MYNQQSNGLPFPFNAIVQPFMNVQPGQPGFNFNLQVYPKLQPYLPYFATCCIEVLQNRANDNALRTLLFNRLANNRYQNDEFLGLVKTACELADFRMGQNPHQSIENVCMQSSAEATEITASYQIQQFPQLQQMLHPQLVQGAMNSLQTGTALMQQVAQYLANRNQMNPVHNPHQSFQNNYQQNPYQPHQQSNQPTGIFNYGGGNYPAVDTTQPSSRSTFNVGQSTQDTHMHSNQQYNAIPADSVSITNMKAPEPQAVTPEPAKKRLPAGEFVSEDERVFKPSKQYPFDVAYNSLTHDRVYLIHPNDTMQPYLVDLTQEQAMDRQKHLRETNSIQAALYEAHQNDQLRKNRISIKDDWVTSGTDELIIKGEVIKNSVRRICASLEEATLGQKSDLYAVGNHFADISIVTIPETLVTSADCTKLLNSMLEFESFIQVASRLKSSLAKARMDTDHEMIKNCQFLEKRIRTELNCYVKKQLGLDIGIGSFIEDSVELLVYVEREYGDVFSLPLYNAQATIIKRAFQDTPEAIAEIFRDWHLPKYEETSANKFKVHILGMSQICVYVNMATIELDIDPNKFKETNYLLSAHRQPTLRFLAEQAFNLAEVEKETISKVTLVTQDGDVFELNKSIFDNKEYTISKAR